MGSLFASKIALNQHCVYFIGSQWQQQLTSIEKHGLLLENFDRSTQLLPAGQFLFPQTAQSSELLEKHVDLIFILTKSAYTAQASRIAASLTRGYQSVILTLQNGIGNSTTIEQIVDCKSNVLLHGTSTHGATMVRVGHVRHTGIGINRIAEVSRLQQNHNVVRQVVDFLNSVGLNSEAVLDQVEADTMIWRKLIVNACINPLTAILQVPNGQLLQTEHCKQTIQQVVHESMAVARACGVKMQESEDEMMQQVFHVIEITSCNFSSMLCDVQRNSQTEIDVINGAIVKLGELHGVATPVNIQLVNRVKQLISTNQ